MVIFLDQDLCHYLFDQQNELTMVLQLYFVLNEFLISEEKKNEN
jgi:hypothetical protein